ncbi:MAG: type II toxin-antitoxin system prevent-host-death family antitoxin, partial [Opitutaceae bacterium]
MQHELARMIAEVEKGGEIIITRCNRPVARLGPVASAASPVAGTPATVRRYWRERPLPPALRSTVTHAELIADSRGEDSARPFTPTRACSP